MHLVKSYLYTPPSLNDELMSYFQGQEELRCDCLHLAITLGTVHLRHSKLVQDHLAAVKAAREKQEPIPPLKGIKISLKEDSSITISEPGFGQGLVRWLAGEGRTELGLIRPHLVQLLCCFDYKDAAFKTILKVCRLGIKAILTGYKCQQSQAITLSHEILPKPAPKPADNGDGKEGGAAPAPKGEPKKEEQKEGDKAAPGGKGSAEGAKPKAEGPKKPEEPKKPEASQAEAAKKVAEPKGAVKQVVKIQSRTSETNFVIRILENDIALLDEALKEKDERQEKEFAEKLASEKAKYFPLHQLTLIKVAKTIDEYIAGKLKERWDPKTLSGIVQLFQAAEKTQKFSHCESIEALLRPNPKLHQTLKLEVRELLSATLPNCTLESSVANSVDDEKEPSIGEKE